MSVQQVFVTLVLDDGSQERIQFGKGELGDVDVVLLEPGPNRCHAQLVVTASGIDGLFDFERERVPPQRGPCGMLYHADDCECGGIPR